MTRARTPAKPMTRVLKWAGSLTAILSLFFGLYQLATMISEGRERGRHVDEAIAVGKAQQAAGDFAAAWESFAVAQTNAEAGGMLAKMAGKLDERQLAVRAAQEDDAMEWLRNIHAGSDEKFSDTVDKILPALVRGSASAQGARKADLLSHIGWAYFLKSRDGMNEAAPDRSYAAAIEADASNPYAHAFWGHWILWNRGNVEDALKHFATAVAGEREKPYVRQIELAALENSRSTAADAEYLAVLAEMQSNGEPLPDRARSRVYSIYSFALYDDPQFAHFAPLVTPRKQIALIEALLRGDGFDESKSLARDGALGVLYEAAGDPAKALAAWQAVRAAAKGSPPSSLTHRADVEVKRLTP